MSADSAKVKNPYLNARRKMNDRNQEVLSTSKTWVIVGFMGMLIGLAGVGGIIYIGSQSKFIPLVIQQDKAGNNIAMYKADKMPPAKQIDFKKAAASFIQNIRIVTADNALQKELVLNTYSHLVANDPATEKANEYLNKTKESNPFVRAQNETVEVEIITVLPQSAESWQVDWNETVRVKNGQLKTKPYTMRAILQLYQGEPTTATTESDALRNEHFIFVRDFNWSKQF